MHRRIEAVKARFGGTRASSAGFATVGLALICTLVTSAIMVGTPVEGGIVDLLSGRSWLTRSDEGLVMLANGSSARIDVLFEVEETAGHDLEVVEVDGQSLLIDRTTGEIRSLDVANLEVGPARALGEPEGLDVVPAGDKLVVVHRNEGVVEVQDPLAGDVLAQADVGSDLTRAVVDDEDQIWVADTDAGVAVPLRLTGRHLDVGDSVRVGAGPDTTLALLDGKPAVVSAARKALVRIDGGRAQEPVRLPFEEGETTQVARVTTGELTSLSVNETGDLIIVRDDRARRVPLGRTGHDLGEPVVFDGRVFVPDFTVGEVIVLDADGKQAGAGIRVGGAKSGRFSVRVEGGRLWVDDPDSDDAFVLGPNDDSFRRVDKGSRDVPSNKDEEAVLAPPAPPPPPPAPTPPAPDATGPPPPQPGTGPETPAPPPPPPPAEPTAPGAPPSVTGTGGDRQVTLAWGAAPPNGAPVESYEVEWEPTGGASGGEPGLQTFPGTQLQATFDGLRNGATYVFTVRASNEVGFGPATASNPVTPDGNVPSAPAGVTATGGLDGTIAVAWEAADANGASAIESYTVTAVDGTGGSIAAATGVTGTSVQVDTSSGLALGGNYTFTVSALNGRGNTSEQSAPSGALTLAAPADAPGSPAAAEADGNLTITWTAPALNGGTLVHYEVTGDAGSQNVAGTTVTFPGLENGRTYNVSIRAITTANGQTLTPGAESVVPGTPGRQATVTMNATASGTTVTWSLTFDGHNSGAATCEVLANGTPIWGPGDCQSFSNRTLAGAYSTNYTLVTRASNRFGPVQSAPVTVRTDPPPPPPRGITVARGRARPADGECSHSSCAYLRVTLSNYAPNTRVTIQCHESQSSPFASYQVTTNANGNSTSEICFFGYPGRQIWASAGGLTAVRFTW